MSQSVTPINKPPHWQTIRLLALYPALYEKTCGVVSADGFNAPRFKRATRAFSHGERCAADFILSVFNHYDYKFDVMEALSVWDAEYRKTFLQWASSPWWE